MAISPDAELGSIERQLFANQVWETVAFAAKAAFMLGLTPWMLRVWGAAGYGEFALASSSFILLSLTDFGIRGRTRVALCRARSSAPEKRQAVLGQSLASFIVIGLIATALAAVLTGTGFLNRVLSVSTANQPLLLVTTVMTMLVLLSGLLLEPLVAIGQIGRLKLATAAGWLLAIPGVALVLWQQGSIGAAIIVWLASLLCANVAAALTIRTSLRGVRPSWNAMQPRAVLASLHGGFWFNVTSSTWLARTYGATFLISALNGPATAGVFFILLRLSEIISALGAISCDVSLGELAQATTPERRRQSFAASYSWAVLLCVQSALVIGFLTPDFYQTWLQPSFPISIYAGLVVAALGFGSAFNRTATYAALGLDAGKAAAKWGLIEALIFLTLLTIVPEKHGLLVRLGLASLAACALVPLAREVSRHLSAPSVRIWLRPFGPIIPGAVASSAILLAASFGSLLVKGVSVALCGGIVLLSIVWMRKEKSENVGSVEHGLPEIS